MSIQRINSDHAPAPIGPYSQATMANGTLYCSGLIALHPETGVLVLDDIQTETHQVLQNLKAVLAAAGMDFNNVVKCSIFLSSMNNFAAVNEVYASYFNGPVPPARETVEVSVLPKNVNVEISAIAVTT